MTACGLCEHRQSNSEEGKTYFKELFLLLFAKTFFLVFRFRLQKYGHDVQPIFTWFVRLSQSDAYVHT